MITFVNAGGAVHTVTKELYKEEYKHCRKVTKAQLKKMNDLAEAIAEQTAIRMGDGSAEEKHAAIVKLQELRAEDKVFRDDLAGIE